MREQNSHFTSVATAPDQPSRQFQSSLEAFADRVFAQNPNFTANPFIAGLAPAIYMLVFGGVNATHTQRRWIESFFRKFVWHC